ncbi:hypothetical protein QAD02_002223 [Eretmocerus hayati]|uniref:Uncharacterized protein n=1 Tax=Eretmocerus hayati TaxID=131215 RepID=A0ACC2NIK9_9HYME|nr:hypothetical protein QAD02_002223 [Eretmocerus hayati]
MTISSRYTAIVNEKGNCYFGVGEMEAFSSIDVNLIQRQVDLSESLPFIVMDANMDLAEIKKSLDLAIEINSTEEKIYSPDSTPRADFVISLPYSCGELLLPSGFSVQHKSSQPGHVQGLEEDYSAVYDIFQIEDISAVDITLPEQSLLCENFVVYWVSGIFGFVN